MPRTSQYDRAALSALLQKQQGVIARAQALECGLTGRVLHYRVRSSGPWQIVLPGVYVTHTGPPTAAERDVAALLYAGPRSVLSGVAALLRHGLSGSQGRVGGPTGGQPRTVDVLVPQTSQRGDAGFARLHRTARLPQRFCVDGEARFALPPRAVADAVRLMNDLNDVRSLVGEAVQRGRCPISLLADELACGPIRDSALLRRALAEVAAGVRSAAEADLRTLIIKARLPTPMFNPRLVVDGEFLAEPDCWWPESGVAGESDSREWHFSPRDWEQTLARHARMSAHGIIVLHFTPGQIRGRRSEVADTIHRALIAGRALPRIRTIPASQTLP